MISRETRQHHVLRNAVPVQLCRQRVTSDTFGRVYLVTDRLRTGRKCQHLEELTHGHELNKIAAPVKVTETRLEAVLQEQRELSVPLCIGAVLVLLQTGQYRPANCVHFHWHAWDVSKIVRTVPCSNTESRVASATRSVNLCAAWRDNPPVKKWA